MRKRKVALIGAGKVGATLAIVLQTGGYEISGVSSLHMESAIQLAARLQCMSSKSPEKIASIADIVLIATPDREIGNVAKRLTERSAVGGGQAVFHVCGSKSADSLQCIRATGAKIGSMHPLQAFSSVESAVPKIPGTYFAVDGDAGAVAIAKEMIAAIGGKWMDIPEQSRALYHAAACMASNYMVSVVHGAVQMFGKLGIAEEDAVAALMPILKGTMENIHRDGTLGALTGPIVRGDIETVWAQLAQIDCLSEDEAELYRDLGRYTTRMAKKRGMLSVEQKEKLDVALAARHIEYKSGCHERLLSQEFS